MCFTPSRHIDIFDAIRDDGAVKPPLDNQEALNNLQGGVVQCCVRTDVASRLDRSKPNKSSEKVVAQARSIYLFILHIT